MNSIISTTPSEVLLKMSYDEHDGGGNYRDILLGNSYSSFSSQHSGSKSISGDNIAKKNDKLIIPDDDLLIYDHDHGSVSDDGTSNNKWWCSDNRYNSYRRFW